MNENLIFFGSIVMIVMIVVIGHVLKAYFRSKEASRSVQAAEDEAEHLHRLALLEERIKVLERIITDEQYELKRRFRDL